MDNVVVTNLKISRQNVKTGEKITMVVYAYSAKPETGVYYLPFRLNASKAKT